MKQLFSVILLILFFACKPAGNKEPDLLQEENSAQEEKNLPPLVAGGFIPCD